jgi:hypothetical protein
MNAPSLILVKSVEASLAPALNQQPSERRPFRRARCAAPNPFRAGALLTLSIAAFLTAQLRGAEIVNLTVGADGQPVNTVADGPIPVLGNGMPGTTTVPSVSADTASGKGSVINFDAGQIIQFEDASRFTFIPGKKFTISARLLVRNKGALGSVYLINHWAYGSRGADRSLAIRLLAQGGKVSPSLMLRHADDMNHATIEPKDVSWGEAQWVHFAVVGDGSMVSFWLNGQESTSSYEIPDMRSSMLPLYIGGTGGAVADDPGAVMQIKDLKILDSAADAAWIQAEATKQ